VYRLGRFGAGTEGEARRGETHNGRREGRCRVEMAVRRRSSVVSPFAAIFFSAIEHRQPTFGTGLESVDTGKPARAFPVTPPCVRVRTRRFGELCSQPISSLPGFRSRAPCRLLRPLPRRVPPLAAPSLAEMGPVSGSCPSARAFAPRFLQTSRLSDASRPPLASAAFAETGPSIAVTLPAFAGTGPCASLTLRLHQVG
jgi:hypothetical protein